MKYVNLNNYPEIQDFLHENSYKKNAEFTPTGAVPVNEPISLRCPQCEQVFLLKARKIRENRKSLCPHCDNNIKLSTPISNSEYFIYWDYDKNNEDPNFISNGTHDKFYWKCTQGHSWYKSPDHMNKLENYCNECYKQNKKIDKEDKRLTDKQENKIKKQGNNKNKKKTPKNKKSVIHLKETVAYNNPELLLDWSENNSINPYKIRTTSSTRVQWVCHNCGYEWSTTVKNRALLGRKCAVCSGKKIMPYYNDVATLHPDIIPFWNQEVNNVDIHTLSKSSNEVFYWRCQNGHSFNRTIRSMVENPHCYACQENNYVVSGINDLETLIPEIKNYWDYDKNEISPKNIKIGSGYNAWWICEKTGKSYQRKVWDFVNRTTISPFISNSQGENSLSSYICEIVPDVDIIKNSRKIISPKELDIYLPDYNIAIEYNGLYWHSENSGKDKYYHYDKWKACKDKGIQLITIWEDDWLNKQEIVKRMILHKLGISIQERIYARNTYVSTIDNKTAKKFCNLNHIQGFVSGSAYLALKTKNTQEVIAVAIYKKNGSEVRLERYCTNNNVIGGMGKLLKAGIRWARKNNCNKIITFSDHEVSNGNLYEKLGFYKDKELAPDYKYVYKGVRVHKFNFRKNRFKNDPELEYDPLMTERELALLNNIPRVWDCGKTKWIINI